jgi:hypothetical protein
LVPVVIGGIWHWHLNQLNLQSVKWVTLMVKGNWERRAELANQRRLEAKQRKIEKKTKGPSIESICVHLLRDQYLNDQRSIIHCYLPLDDNFLVCKLYLRAECSAKRCKYAHEGASISMLRTSCDSIFDDKQLQEAGLKEPILLQNLEIKYFAQVRVISIDSTIVFDSENPNAWKIFSEHQNQIKKDRELDVLEEIEEDQADATDTKVVSEREATEEPTGETARNIFVNILQATPSIICNVMLSYLSDFDLCNIIQANRHIRDLCLRNDYYRYRKKEGLSTNGALAARISKEKKNAKKKKSKEAFIAKTDKRDAFARGIAR